MTGSLPCGLAVADPSEPSDDLDEAAEESEESEEDEVIQQEEPVNELFQN